VTVICSHLPCIDHHRCLTRRPPPTQPAALPCCSQHDSIRTVQDALASLSLRSWPSSNNEQLRVVITLDESTTPFTMPWQPTVTPHMDTQADDAASPAPMPSTRTRVHRQRTPRRLLPSEWGRMHSLLLATSPLSLHVLNESLSATSRRTW